MTKDHSNKRIFIGGTGRSGTSVLLRALIRAKDTIGYYEPQFLAHKRGFFQVGKKETVGVYRDLLQRYFWDKIRHAYARAHKNKNGEAVEKYTQENIMHAFDYANSDREFVENIYKIAGYPNIVHKQPHIVRYVDKIEKMFPEMKFIHTIRDPKDIAVSTYVQNWGANNVWQFIDMYKEVMGDALKSYKLIDPKNYLVVSVEKLVEEPTETYEKIKEFTGLDYEVEKLTKSVKSKEDANVGRGSALTDREIELIERECYPLYKQFLELESHGIYSEYLEAEMKKAKKKLQEALENDII